MQFMTSLLGGSDNTLLNSAFALGIVLALIVGGLWTLKVLTRAGGNVGRGRNRRLSVVDSAMVDGKRRVVIIRRDNVEHLILTGGPQDLVIETGLAAPEPAHPRRPVHAPQAAAAPAHAADIRTPAEPQSHAVPREAVDRLRDLARPAPLKPRTARQPQDVIPIATALRGDNSAGAAADSARTGPGDGANGRARFGRNRFIRSIGRGDGA